MFCTAIYEKIHIRPQKTKRGILQNALQKAIKGEEFVSVNRTVLRESVKISSRVHSECTVHTQDFQMSAEQVRHRL